MGIVTLFGLGRWYVADRLEKATIIEPVHPFESSELDGFQRAPRSAWFSPSSFVLGLIRARKLIDANRS